ncbi:MAG: aminotransferase class I/II-fold pyridoxal phosphate-dependent enzyme, partial [Candidatus Acidiferrales bacterium]
HKAQEEYEALLKRGVIVRPMGFMGLPAGLRVTVGTPEENQRVVEAFAYLQAARAAGEDGRGRRE